MLENFVNTRLPQQGDNVVLTQKSHEAAWGLRNYQQEIRQLTEILRDYT